MSNGREWWEGPPMHSERAKPFVLSWTSATDGFCFTKDQLADDRPNAYVVVPFESRTPQSMFYNILHAL